MSDSKPMPRTPETRPARVRISDVARRLGVTKSTVSRALNDYTDISEATRKRVQTAAREMGYRPLVNAQAIRTGRTRALGLVLELDAHDQFSPFLAEFLGGVTQAASAEGWSLTVASAAYGTQMRETVDGLVLDQKVDGFIIPRTRVADDRIAHLQEIGVPCVLYGRTGYGSAEQDLSWYDVDGFDAFRLATERLAELGHERIGFIGFDATFNFTHLRRDGYLAALIKTGRPADPALAAQGAVNAQSGFEAVLRVMRHPLPPTALVIATDEIALGAYDAAIELGLEIGTDLSVIAYDGIPRGRHTTPQLTSYRVDNHAAGAALAHLLIRQLRGEDPAALRDMGCAELQPGGSDGPPRLTSFELAAKIARHTNRSIREET